MTRGSLTIVGTGIKAVGQITLDAVVCMRRAGKLLYLVGDPVTQHWMNDLNPTAESLSGCYVVGEPRPEAYRRITEMILSHVRSGTDVCAAFYGHPGVFVQPSHNAIRIARLEGFRAHMMPGISSEDCLFADLSLDPGDRGCQTYEATGFVLRKPQIDSSVPLILLQIGVIGMTIHQSDTSISSNVEILVTLLKQSYPAQHEVVVYEAAQFPICQPQIQRVQLSDLAECTMSVASTLLIPPCNVPMRYPEIAVALRTSFV